MRKWRCTPYLQGNGKTAPPPPARTQGGAGAQACMATRAVGYGGVAWQGGGADAGSKEGLATRARQTGMAMRPPWRLWRCTAPPSLHLGPNLWKNKINKNQLHGRSSSKKNVAPQLGYLGWVP